MSQGLAAIRVRCFQGSKLEHASRVCVCVMCTTSGDRGNKEQYRNVEGTYTHTQWTHKSTQTCDIVKKSGLHNERERERVMSKDCVWDHKGSLNCTTGTVKSSHSRKNQWKKINVILQNFYVKKQPYIIFNVNLHS